MGIIDTKIFGAEDISSAAEILRRGGTVAFPTETVYGLGANALSAEAVKKIFEAKGRPNDNPLIVHIAEIEMLADIAAEVPEKAKLLMDKFWSGPLTIILKRKKTVPDAVTAGLDTVGIRMPSEPMARELIRLSGVPVAAPSANLSGKPSPTTSQHVIDDLNGRVDGILCGGDCAVGVESTVIDMSGDVPTILRPGGITAGQIEEVIGEVRSGRGLSESEAPKSPGMKYRHYAPSAKVMIFRDISEVQGDNIGVLTFERDAEKFRNTTVYSLGDTPQSAANRLFGGLRELDRLGVDTIYAPEIPNTDEWMAVRNRLYKAAGAV